MYKIKSKKAQVSFEVIVAVMFIIIFLFIFTQLAEATHTTIETNHIRVQQNEIAYSINDFFQTIKDVVGTGGFYDNDNITEFRVEYEVPNIVIGSKHLGCVIEVETNRIEITTTHNRDFKKIISGLNLGTIDGTFYCGQTIVCEKNDNNIDCS
jgi:hypothetical protein